MARRIIKKLNNFTVRYDSEWKEYTVTRNGANISLDSYHTDDKQDAVDTAEMLDKKS